MCTLVKMHELIHVLHHGEESCFTYCSKRNISNVAGFCVIYCHDCIHTVYMHSCLPTWCLQDSNPVFNFFKRFFFNLNILHGHSNFVTVMWRYKQQANIYMFVCEYIHICQYQVNFFLLLYLHNNLGVNSYQYRVKSDEKSPQMHSFIHLEL